MRLLSDIRVDDGIAHVTRDKRIYSSMGQVKNEEKHVGRGCTFSSLWPCRLAANFPHCGILAFTKSTRSKKLFLYLLS